MQKRRWILAGLLTTMIVVTGRAADGPALPADLNLIPRDATMFVSIRVGDLWAHPATKSIRDLVTSDPKILRELAETTGLQPQDVERLTLMIPTLSDEVGPPVVIVSTVKPYSRAKLLAGMRASNPRSRNRAVPADPVPKKLTAPEPPGETKRDEVPAQSNIDPDAPYYHPFGDPRRGLILIDDRTFVFMESIGRDGATSMITLMGQLLRQRPDGGLTDSLQVASGKHHFVGGLNPVRLLKSMPDDQMPVTLLPLRTLFQTQEATLTLDLGEVSKVGIDLRFTEGATAKRAKQTIEAFRTLALEMLPSLRKQIARETGSEAFLMLFDEFDKALGNAAVEAKDKTVSVRADMKTDVALATAITTATQRVREAAARANALNHFKQIALSFHNYESTFGYFPAASDPQPPHKFPVSWRVLILPYIEQENLYRQYRFDEPWDSENNKKLIPLMPKVYEIPNYPAKEKGQTFIKVFTGREAMFVPGQRNSLVRIQDGTSNTLMVVEAAEPVIWTKPDDIVYDPKKPLPKLGGHFAGGFIVAMGDGSVRFIKNTIAEDVLRALITANGGEAIGVLD